MVKPRYLAAIGGPCTLIRMRNKVLIKPEPHRAVSNMNLG